MFSTSLRPVQGKWGGVGGRGARSLTITMALQTVKEIKSLEGGHGQAPTNFVVNVTPAKPFHQFTVYHKIFILAMNYKIFSHEL